MHRNLTMCHCSKVREVLITIRQKEIELKKSASAVMYKGSMIQTANHRQTIMSNIMEEQFSFND